MDRFINHTDGKNRRQGKEKKAKSTHRKSAVMVYKSVKA